MTADEQRRIMDRLIDLHCDECGEEICTDECQCQDCRENADMKAGTV